MRISDWSSDVCSSDLIKDILFRAAERTRVRVTLVANQRLRTPHSRFIEAIQVPGGFDVADSAIVERVRAGDLVVTQDIPLAARVIERGAAALNPHGERHTDANMRSEEHTSELHSPLLHPHA